MSAAPTAISGDRWRPAEIGLLREHYPSGGAKGCGRLLPHRSIRAIYERAHQLGLHSRDGRGRKPRHG